MIRWAFQKKRWIILAPMAILLFVFAGGEIVKSLWNWLIPAVLGGREITFWQAIGILALSRILFGGFKGQSFGRSRIRRRMDEERWKNRWAQLTPEQQERARQGMPWYGCSGPSVSETKAE